MPDDPPVETPNRLAYRDGRVPDYGREDGGVLATLFAALALAFAAVPWGLMLIARVSHGGGCGMACLVVLADGVAGLCLLLSVTSEPREPRWISVTAIALIVTFWVAVWAGAWG